MKCNDPECSTGEHGEEWRCIRHSKHRDAAGRKKPCRGRRLLGAKVCRMHGVNEPARESARQRLNNLVDPALTVMNKALARVESNPGTELHPQVVRVAIAVLDRAGFPAGLKVEVEDKTGPSWFVFATVAEKKTVSEIMERCLKRMPEG